MSLATWIPAVGAVIAALVAGTVAVYQSRRTLAAQRSLEHEKLHASEQAAVLAQERVERSQERSVAQSDRREQVLPFLECLNEALNASYASAYLPEHFPDLGARIPQVRSHSDRGLRAWFAATEAMSRHRIRLLLALDGRDLDRIVTQLVDLTQQMSKTVDTRHKLWYGAVSRRDLWEAQREYVRIGYGLMLDIRSAVSSRPVEHAVPASEETVAELARRLSVPLEQSSAVSVPYGSTADFAWVCIWEIDARADWLKFVEGMNAGTLEEFVESLAGLLRGMRERDDVIESNLIMVRGKEEAARVYCLHAKFPGAASMEEFVEHALPGIRKNFPLAWSSFRQPIELNYGLHHDGEPGSLSEGPG